MKMLRNALFAVAALASLTLAPMPAFAASTIMCAPGVPGAVGSRRVTNPNTSTSYTLNGIGCALIGSADIGYFLSQGFAPDAPLRSVTASGQTAAFTLTIPAGAYIERIVLQETSGAAVTGGIKVGTSSGGTQVAAAILLGASGLTATSDAAFSTNPRLFSATVPQTLFFGAVSSFNSAAVNATVVYSLF